MLRFVVKLVPKDRNPKDEEHYFPTYQEAADFAVQNRTRYMECYSEERKTVGKTEYWSRHAEYNVFYDPNN